MAARGSGTFGDCGLDDTLDEMRASMRRFVDDKVKPNAHQWHLDNAYVPMEVIGELASLGVFALTLPERYGGMGLGKESMCVVSEELSRGWIAVGLCGLERVYGGGRAGSQQRRHHNGDQRRAARPRGQSMSPSSSAISSR